MTYWTGTLCEDLRAARWSSHPLSMERVLRIAARRSRNVMDHARSLRGDRPRLARQLDHHSAARSAKKHLQQHHNWNHHPGGIRGGE
jgi:hypothetical protein